MRIITDIFAFCAGELRNKSLGERISHPQAARRTCVHFRDGLMCVRWASTPGSAWIAVPRMSFFFNAHNDFFERSRNIAQRRDRARCATKFARTTGRRLRFQPSHHHPWQRRRSDPPTVVVGSARRHLAPPTRSTRR